MFQFTPFPLSALYIHAVVRTHYDAWVPPFGNLRVIRYLLLTAAYRSLSRPSSAPDAKAFTLRSFSLELPISIRFSHELSEFLNFCSGFLLSQ